MSDTVHAMADQLRQYATHFAPSDWDYTRDLGDLKPLHFGSRWPSIKQAARYLARGTNLFPNDPDMRPSRWRMASAALRGYDSHPDGALDNGNIITHWEETGEYLQYVQPSVGALLADLMDAHPELPEVQAVAIEMKRINDRYGERLAEEES